MPLPLLPPIPTHSSPLGCGRSTHPLFPILSLYLDEDEVDLITTYVGIHQPCQYEICCSCQDQREYDANTGKLIHSDPSKPRIDRYATYCSICYVREDATWSVIRHASERDHHMGWWESQVLTYQATQRIEQSQYRLQIAYSIIPQLKYYFVYGVVDLIATYADIGCEHHGCIKHQALCCECVDVEMRGEDEITKEIATYPEYTDDYYAPPPRPPSLPNLYHFCDPCRIRVDQNRINAKKRAEFERAERDGDGDGDEDD